jgi:hypothetical protein
MQPIMRAPNPRCQSRESENPILRSVASAMSSSAVADDDMGCTITTNRNTYADSAKLRHSLFPRVHISGSRPFPFLTH